MSTQTKPLSNPPDVSCKYGAPVGRRDVLPDDRNAHVKLCMVRLPFVDMCYDRGGAYWGAPATVYRAADADRSVDCYVRAPSRRDAKAKVRTLLPNARFFR